MREEATSPFYPPPSTESSEPNDAAAPRRFSDILAIRKRLQDYVGTPEHQQRLAVEARLRSERQCESIRRRASEMEIPLDKDLRSVVENDDAPNTSAMLAVRSALKWRGTQRRGMLLVLGGETGVGKTAAACHALARFEQGGLYVRAETICATTRTGFSSVEDIWARWTRTPLMVIDDAGTEEQRPKLLGNLLLMRFDHGLITVASTNLSNEKFAQRYLTEEHGRLADRLINAQGRAVGEGPGEDGQPWYIDIKGASLRSVEVRNRLRGKKQ